MLIYIVMHFHQIGAVAAKLLEAIKLCIQQSIFTHELTRQLVFILITNKRSLRSFTHALKFICFSLGTMCGSC